MRTFMFSLWAQTALTLWHIELYTKKLTHAEATTSTTRLLNVITPNTVLEVQCQLSYIRQIMSLDLNPQMSVFIGSSGVSQHSPR